MLRLGRISVRLGVLIVAVLAVAVAVASVYVVIVPPSPKSDPTPTPVPTPTPGEVAEGIARAWAEDNIRGVAGDELVEFRLTKESNTARYEDLRRYLKERIHRATTWSYGPTLDLGSRYGVTATASVQVHEIRPSRFITSEGVVEGEEIIVMPFHLSVDLASESVTDWHVHTDEATYDTNRPESMESLIDVAIDDVLRPEAMPCFLATMAAEVTEPDVVAALLKNPEERDPIEAIRLSDAISAAGLGDVCEEWAGEPPER